MHIVKKYPNGEEYIVYYPDEIAELLLNSYPDKFSRLSEEEALEYENQDDNVDNPAQTETSSIGFYPNPEGEQFVRRRRGRRRRIISDES